MKRSRLREDQPTAARARDLAEFDQRLKAATRVAPITGALISVNVVLWLAMVWQHVDWLKPSPDALALWGANGPLTAEGQGWRLLTAVFLHQGLLQLIFNQWALYQLGTLVERLVGHVGLALIYLISGFAAGLASLLARPEAVTAGSTPAITGLLGAVIAYHFRVRGTLPPGVLLRLRASVFVFLAWNIGYGILTQQLDSPGFLAGLATGGLCGLVVALPLGEGRGLRRILRNAFLATGGAALVFAAAYVVQPSALGGEIARYREVNDRSLRIYAEASQRLAGDDIRPEQFVKIIEQEVLPDWEQQAQRFRDLKDVPEAAAPLVKTIDRSMALRAETWRLQTEVLAIGDAIEQDHAASQQIISAFAAAQDRFRKEKLTPDAFLAIVEGETLPQLASVQKRLSEQTGVPEAFQSPLKTWRRALDLRVRALSLIVESLRVESEYDRYQRLSASLVKQSTAARERLAAGELSADRFAEQIEEILDKWGAEQKRMQALAETPGSFGKLLSATTEAMQARERAWQRMTDSPPADESPTTGSPPATDKSDEPSDADQPAAAERGELDRLWKQADDLAAAAASEWEAAGGQRAVQAEVDKLWHEADDLEGDFRAAANQAGKDALATVSAKAEEADLLEKQFLDGIQHLHDAPADE